MKIPLTPAGIEPATFRFGAQHLNPCNTAFLRYQGLMKNLQVAVNAYNIYKYIHTF